MANRVPAVDDSSYQLPTPVRERIGDNLADPLTPEGGAVRDSIGKWLVFDVRRYGAVADGATSDSPAFQAAADAAAAVGGGVVRVPAGDYAIGSVVRLGANTVVSMHGATLHRTAPGGDIFQNWAQGDTTTTGYNGRSNISILGGVIDSHGDTYLAESNVVTFNHCRDIFVRGVVFRRTRGFHSLELNGVDGGWVDQCRFEGYAAGSQSNKEALQIDCALSPTDSGAGDETVARNITVRDCVFTGFGAMGAHTVGVGSHSHATSTRYSNIQIMGCRVDSPLTRGIVAYWWEDSAITNCVVSITSGVQAIRVEACEDTTVMGAKVSGPGAVGVTVLGSSTNCSVIGCIITGTNEGIYDGAGDVDTIISSNTVRRTTSYGVTIDGSSRALVTSNRIAGAGYTAGGLGSIRLTGTATAPSVVSNKVSPHGAGTEPTAAVSVNATVTDAWVFGNDFRGMPAATSGTVNTTSNRI